MAAKQLHLSTCPYCENGGGEIRVDPDRVALLHKSYEEDFLRADLAPDLNPFVLDSGEGKLGPCKHLVFLTGAFRYLELGKEDVRGGMTWNVTCDWWHPAVDQLEDELESFIVQLSNEVDVLPGGDVPLGIEWFSREWPDQQGKGRPARRYAVDARALFCRDAAAFFHDFAEHGDAYGAWWNGEDPLGTGLFVEGCKAAQLGGPPVGSGRSR